MSRRSSRRQFLQQSAALSTACWVAAPSFSWSQPRSANEVIRFACIGVEGKGSSDRDDAGRHGEVVALCDIDQSRLDKAGDRYPKAKKFFDYREMYDSFANQFDAITVSTPDHTHAPSAIRGMKMGKHCFCQKPLTYTVAEARMMRLLAEEKKICTQMGNQGTAANGLREAAQVIKQGTIGGVKEVHIWTNRPVWPQGIPRLPKEDCPDSIKWDLFIGAAPFRDYNSGYHPFKWRGWLDFGTGALGDMACHTMNMAAMALELFDPVSVEPVMIDANWTPEHQKETFPKASVLRYEFAARGDMRPCSLFWYDGGQRPSLDKLPLTDPSEVRASGSLVIGEKGYIHSSNDYHNDYKIYPLDKFGSDRPEYVKSPGHFTEFANAIKESKPELAWSNFNYAGRLTETVLLGNVALRTGKKIEWDAPNLKVKGDEAATRLITREYRAGFGL